MSKGMLVVLLALLMVLVASGMLVSATDAAVPGDWMYGVDRAMDGLRLRLALDPKQKAQVERQLAQERLHEAQTLVRRGDLENVELLRQESRLAMLAAKAADPHYARKTEKPTATPAQVEQNEQRLEQTGQAKGDPYCNGTATKHNTAGVKLAQRLSVSYSEVMAWYCQGYAFSEIGLAYRISQAAGVTVNEVFAQRLSELGWGEILQKYGLDEKLDKDVGKIKLSTTQK
jgi:hypothetical protein